MISTVSTKSPLTLFPNLQEQNNYFLWKGFIKKCKKRGHNHRKGSGALYRQLNRSQIKALLEKARDPCLVSGRLPKIDTVLNIFELTKPRLWSKIGNFKQGWEILKILQHSFSFKIPTVPYQELKRSCASTYRGCKVRHHQSLKFVKSWHLYRKQKYSNFDGV